MLRQAAMSKRLCVAVLYVGLSACSPHRQSGFVSDEKCWDPTPPRGAGVTTVEAFIIRTKGSAVTLRARNCPAEGVRPQYKTEAIRQKLLDQIADADRQNRNELQVISVRVDVVGKPGEFNAHSITVLDVSQFRKLSPISAQEVYGRLLQDQFYHNQLSPRRDVDQY